MATTRKFALILLKLTASTAASGILVYVMYLLFPYFYMYVNGVGRDVLSEDYLAAFQFSYLAIVVFVTGIPLFFVLTLLLSKIMRKNK